MLKDAQNVAEEKFPLSESTVEKITEDMYGVINSGGTGAALKLQGIEFSGKSGTAQVIGYTTRDRIGKEKKFLDNAWFVGYAPRRNPEIVVSVLVQESGKHGGEAAGPVVKDLIKAYYDKKNKKMKGELTTEKKGDKPKKNPVSVAALAPRAALKPDDTSDVLPVRAATEPRR
jgi:penicillin-binding protein 2